MRDQLLAGAIAAGAGAAAVADRHGPRMRAWQVTTAAALLVGYSGYYLCRSNLSVVVPALVADPGSGLDRTAVGAVASAGILAYAAGKSLTGVAGDFWGGRRLFLLGLFGSVAATVAFSAGSGVVMLGAAWIANRFVQSAGWGGLTKTAAHWFPPDRYGLVMSVLSLSFLFGDAAGRYLLGAWLSDGLSWRGVFVAAAAVLTAIGLADIVVLRDSPAQLGLPVPPVSGANVHGDSGAASRPASLRDLLAPYLASRAFWLVCGIAFGMTLIREAFNTWVPAYLVDAHGVTAGLAAQYSALFPLVGGVSALAVGVLTDRVGDGNRVTVIVPAAATTAAALLCLALATAHHDLTASLAAIGVTAFCLLGPYTLLAGAIAMDLGGRKGSASAAGLIDTAGYAGGTLSGVAVGRLVDVAGWAAAFCAMAALAVAVAVVAAAYCIDHRRRATAVGARVGA